MPVGRPTLLLLLLAAPAAGQNVTRLANDEPEIRLDARGRNGVCDVLAFTPDGTTLLAAGEDKVVHRWAVGPTGLTPAGKPLTWNTFRERRGSIYALAADPAGGRVAVAGFGKTEADVALLDTRTGAITHALSARGDPGYTAREAVWALGFHGADRRELAVGDDAGNVWSWRPGEADAAGRLRQRAKGGELALGSRVVWVGDLPDGRLAFAKRDGGVYLADGGKLLHKWGPAVGLADRVVASGDGKALAARPYAARADGNGVEVWWPATGAVKTVPAPADHRPERTALDAAGKRLAVGYIDFSDKRATGFQYDRPGEVRVYDLTADPPREVAKLDGLPACPDQIALHPTRDWLATADADTHDTTLWDQTGGTFQRLDRQRSDTPAVFAVGLSTDGRHLSTKTGRAAVPAHPNRRAAGDWTSFDLTGDRRGWAATAVAPEPPLDTWNKWRVEFDPTDEANWAVVDPDGKRFPLKALGIWDQARDDLPRCYTFLNGPTGARLAIGHLWGASVYDLRPGRPPVRVRKLVGHAGVVLAVAPTHGGNGLVTAGRDHAVALWNLADFPLQSVLGASFAERNGTVEVTDVDPGSPADECGLARGYQVNKLVVTDYLPKVHTDTPATPAARLAALRAARPGVELAFHDVRKPGSPAELCQCRTLNLHRPVAKFVPLGSAAGGGNEWVLYTYRQCFYDSSANGDRAVQWLVAKNRAADTPDVFPVDQFRGTLHKPDKVTAVLAQQTRERAQPLLVDKYPPVVQVEPAAPTVAGNADLKVTVWVTPRNNHLGRPNPAELVELWANDDTRIAAQPLPPGPPAAAGAPFALGQRVPVVFTVPNAALVSGANSLQGAALSRDGGWGTASRPAAVTLTTPTPRGRRLFVVSAGIGKYEFDPGQDVTFPDLDSHKDATRLGTAWDLLAGAGLGGFSRVGPTKLILNEAVTRESVLAAVAAVATDARGDDLFVLALSGHGILGDRAGKLRGLARGQQVDPDTWYFAIPQAADGSKLVTRDDYRTPARVRQAFLTDADLFDAVSAVRCRKLLVIDCCHSGKLAQAGAGGQPAVTKNAGGLLNRNGFGPVVLTACAANEKAIEHPQTGAVFTSALISALTVDKAGGRFSPADANADGRLTARELAAFLAKVVTEEAAKLRSEDGPRHPQHAQATPAVAELARLVVAEKKSEQNPAGRVGSER